MKKLQLRQIVLLLLIFMVGVVSAAFKPWESEPTGHHIAITDPNHKCLPWETYWVSPLAPEESIVPGDLVLMKPELTGVPALASVEKPIAKFVLAGPGATVEWTPEGMKVDGRKYDEFLHPVLLTAGGTKVLTDQEYILVGVTDTSFDSRYFGPVPRQAIVSRVHPILALGWEKSYMDDFDVRTANAIDFILSRRDPVDRGRPGSG
jgi:conjugal transfer pilin signal peptidase TrbI